MSPDAAQPEGPTPLAFAGSLINLPHMRPPIGFVLLTYNQPRQLLHLIRRLMALYDNPPIVCHHDFNKSSLTGFEFPNEVTFVRPHILTRWGHISLIYAFLAALRALYDRFDSPDWFVFLSGSDYPVCAPERTLRDFAEGGFDAYLDHRVVEYAHTPPPGASRSLYGFEKPGWVPTAYERYLARRFWFPWFSWSRRKPIKVQLLTVRAPALVRPFTPFSDTFRCYGGEFWFSGNREVARRLLADTPRTRQVLAHFRNRFVPEEGVVHSILCNESDLKISTDKKRYIDWSRGGPHPKVLGLEDLPRIIASGAHFARKFDLDAGEEVFRHIDYVVDEQRRGRSI